MTGPARSNPSALRGASARFVEQPLPLPTELDAALAVQGAATMDEAWAALERPASESAEATEAESAPAEQALSPEQEAAWTAAINAADEAARKGHAAVRARIAAGQPVPPAWVEKLVGLEVELLRIRDQVAQDSPEALPSYVFVRAEMLNPQAPWRIGIAAEIQDATKRQRPGDDLAAHWRIAATVLLRALYGDHAKRSTP